MVQKTDKVFCLVTGSKKKISVMYTSEKNHDKLEQMTQFIHVRDFRVNYNRYFSKTVTACMLHQYKDKNYFYFLNIDFIRKLYPEAADDMKYILKYLDLHWNNNYHRRSYGNKPDDFYASSWEIALRHKLYDHEAVAIFRRTQEFIGVAKELEMLKVEKTTIVPAAIDVAKKLLNYEIKNLRVKRY